jgi:hypothetical protein
MTASSKPQASRTCSGTGRACSSADPIGDSRRAFVTYWYQEHGTETVYASDLIPAAGLADFANIDPDKKSKDLQRVAKSEQTKMDTVLTKMVEVVFDLPDEGVRVTVSRGAPKQDKGGSRWRLIVKGRLVAPMAPDDTYGTSSEGQAEQEVSANQGLPLNPNGPLPEPPRAGEQVPQVPSGATGAIESRPEDPEDVFPGAAPCSSPAGSPSAPMGARLRPAGSAVSPSR